MTAAAAAVAVGPTCSVEAEDEILAFLDDLEEEEVDPGVTRFFFFGLIVCPCGSERVELKLKYGGPKSSISAYVVSKQGWVSLVYII